MSQTNPYRAPETVDDPVVNKDIYRALALMALAGTVLFGILRWLWLYAACWLTFIVAIRLIRP